MAPSLSIQLLGEFCVLEASSVVPNFAAPRLQALLALLLLHRGIPQSRHYVAACLWPDSTSAQALTNLRNLLHRLRHSLPQPDRFLVATASTVLWRDDAPCHCDLASFEQAVAQAEACDQAAQYDALRHALETVVAQYRGDLLPSCYDDWIMLERERLRRRFLHSLERLLTLLERERDYPAALAVAQRLQQAEPLHEAHYLRLMRLYLLNGDRAAALHSYAACATVLQHELHTQPSHALRETFTRLLEAETGLTPSELPTHPLIGRHQAWAALLDCWQSAVVGKLQLALLVGEAGIGKTRLAEELLHWAAQQGLTVVRTACYNLDGDLAYAPLSALLRSAPLQAAIKRLHPAWQSEIARLLPELRTSYPALPPAHALREPWQRQHLFAACVQAVLLAPAPLLFFIDDLHCCDQATLAWLEYLFHTQQQAHLLLVGTLRPEEVEPHQPLTQLLTTLQSRGQSTTIPLPALNADETAALATQLHAGSLSQAATTAIFRESEGNPLFIVEMMRAGHDPQLLQATSGQGSLPSRIYTMIALRLGRLSPPAQSIVSVAAIIGRAFPYTLLAESCPELAEATLVAGLDELCQRRILCELHATYYDFSHAKLREVASSQLSSARRLMLHRQVAAVLETLYPAQHELSAQIASHYVQAGCPDKAMRAYQRAAEAAQRVFASAEAAAYYRHGLALLADSAAQQMSREEQCKIEHELESALADNLAQAGQHAAARAAYERARERTPQHNQLELARLQRLIGNSWRAQAEFGQAEQAYQTAFALLGRIVQHQDEAYWQECIALYFEYIDLYLWAGRADDFRQEQIAHLEAMLTRYGSAAQQAHGTHLLLLVSWWQHNGRVGPAIIAKTAHVLDLYRAAGDLRLLAFAHWNIGLLQFIHGNVAEAAALVQRALADAEQVGDIQLQIRCLVLQSLVYRRRGQISKLVANHMDYSPLAQTYKLCDCIGAAYADQAWLAWRNGEAEAAQQYAQQALATWRASPIVYPLQWSVLWPLIAIELAQHQLAAAIQHAQALLHPLQHWPPEALTNTLRTAISAYAQADHTTTCAQLEQALSRAQELGFL